MHYQDQASRYGFTSLEMEITANGSHELPVNKQSVLLACCARPPQVPPRCVRAVGILGRIGFAFKALVYGILGGLICRSAISDESKNESPQGVFVLLAGFPVSQVWLTIMAIGLTVYALWRLAEGFVGQGYSPSLGAFANFFRFRLSPVVSGIVYVLYTVYIIALMARSGEPMKETDFSPGISFFVALAFLIGCLAQLVHTFGGQFLDELSDFVFSRKALSWTMNGLGRVGFFGRACIFMLVSVLFWKSLAGTLSDDEGESRGKEPAISRAMISLHSNRGGRAFLFIVGFTVIIYAVFALLCVFFRDFPTRRPEYRRRASIVARVLGHRQLPEPSEESVEAQAPELQIVESWEMPTNPLPLPPARDEPVLVHGASSRLAGRAKPLTVVIPT